jgi:hypothetical protein
MVPAVYLEHKQTTRLLFAAQRTPLCIGELCLHSSLHLLDHQTLNFKCSIAVIRRYGTTTQLGDAQLAGSWDAMRHSWVKLLKYDTEAAELGCAALDNPLEYIVDLWMGHGWE